MKNAVTVEMWRNLYALAVQIREMRPWTWLRENDVFAVEGPANVVFLSVMGANREHFALAVYASNEAISLFWKMQSDDNPVRELVLEMPQLQVSFEDRGLLEAEDLRIVKQLGLTFRGPNAWPQFRSYRPGFVPWFLDGDEADVLMVAMEQLIALAPSLKDDPSRVRNERIDTYLIRTKGPQGAWRNEVRRIPLVPVDLEDVAPSADAVRRGRQLRAIDAEFELDLFLLPAPIMSGKARPFYPYCLLVVDRESGAVVGQSLMDVQTSVNDMLRAVPERILEVLERADCRPMRIHVRPGRMEAALGLWCKSIGIELSSSRRLDQLDPARESLMTFMRRPQPGGPRQRGSAKTR